LSKGAEESSASWKRISEGESVKRAALMDRSSLSTRAPSIQSVGIDPQLYLPLPVADHECPTHTTTKITFGTWGTVAATP
jgi:hypothetical protein